MKIDPVLDQQVEEEVLEEQAQESGSLERINSWLDRVFRDPALKYGLKFFEKNEREHLQLRETVEGRIEIFCFGRRRWLRAKPEEVVRRMVATVISR